MNTGKKYKTAVKSNDIPALAAAYFTQLRCETYRMTKRLNSLPRKPMSNETLKQLGLV